MKPVSWKVPPVLLRCRARCPEELDAEADGDGHSTAGFGIPRRLQKDSFISAGGEEGGCTPVLLGFSGTGGLLPAFCSSSSLMHARTGQLALQRIRGEGWRSRISSPGAFRGCCYRPGAGWKVEPVNTSSR